MTNQRYLAADRRNLFSWLSRGLIVPRALMDKYRPDALDAAANTLPVASEAAVGRLGESAEYPVAVELAPEVGVSSVGDSDLAVLLTRGALSARRIARVHVPTSAAADEMRARAYRGFDAGALDIQVSPTLFAVQGLGPEWPPIVSDTYNPPDDRVLKRREAVAGAVMSMSSGRPQAPSFPDQFLTQNEADDPVRSLVQAAQAAGVVTRQDDVELLHGTLVAIYDQSADGDIVASALLARIAGTVTESRVAGLGRHLDRILELSRGQDELKPFKTHGGLLTTKALLLYLLRPDPEAVRSWSDEDLNAEQEVLQLSGLLAGFASRYGGLPSSLRGGDRADELLDWVARGLQPSDFTLSVDTTQQAQTPTAGPSSAADANPLVDALRQDVAAGEHNQALAVARALEWSECLQLQVTADSFRAGVTSGQVCVTFTPGAALTWSLLQEPFIDRLSGLSDADLDTALKPKRTVGRRAPVKSARATATRATRKKAQDPTDESTQHVAEDEGTVGPSSPR
jgi:hypothetical protein